MPPLLAEALHTLTENVVFLKSPYVYFTIKTALRSGTSKRGAACRFALLTPAHV